MKVMFILTGKTYAHKDTIKADGFRWNPDAKAWQKVFTDADALKEASDKYMTLSLNASTRDLPESDEKKYWVKESWISNLESMHDKLWCIQEDVREGKIALPFTAAGKTINSEDDIDNLMREADELECRAKSGKVTGAQYGRIQQIVSWRVSVRYAACMAAGMPESDAGRCFEDM